MHSRVDILRKLKGCRMILPIGYLTLYLCEDASYENLKIENAMKKTKGNSYIV